MGGVRDGVVQPLLSGWLRHWPGCRHRLGLARCLAKSFRLILDPRLQKCLGEIRGKSLRKTKGVAGFLRKHAIMKQTRQPPPQTHFRGPVLHQVVATYSPIWVAVAPNFGWTCSPKRRDLHLQKRDPGASWPSVGLGAQERLHVTGRDEVL